MAVLVVRWGFRVDGCGVFKGRAEVGWVWSRPVSVYVCVWCGLCIGRKRLASVSVVQHVV